MRTALCRRSVRNQLKQIGLQSEVHKVLLQFQQAGQPLTAETALDVLKGKGVLDQLVRTIQPTATSQPPVQSVIQSTSHGLEEPTELPK